MKNTKLCPDCGIILEEEDFICDECGWSETNDLTCSECGCDVDLCECVTSNETYEVYYAINKQVRTAENSPTTTVFGMQIPIEVEFINSFYLIDGNLVDEYSSRKLSEVEENYFVTNNEAEAIAYKKQQIMDNNIMIMNELNKVLIKRIDEVYTNQKPNLDDLSDKNNYN